MHELDNAGWIVPQCLSHIEQIDIFHKEQDYTDIPLPDEYKNLHIIYRCSFTCKVTPMTLHITADDYYKLYINGRLVGQGPAQSYCFSYNYNSYDITPYIREGENEIFADVYYQGLINRAYQSGDRRMGMIASCTADGKTLFVTDESWQCALSDRYIYTHTIGYDTVIAENVDLSKPCVEFSPCVVKHQGHSFCSHPVKPVDTYPLKPVSVIKRPDGVICDFGGEITGGISLRANGRAGDKVRILLAEELDGNGGLRFDMRCNSKCEEYIILAEGDNCYTQYEYKGFRYAQLIAEGDAAITSVEALVRHYPFDDDYCRLETDDPVLSSVWDICKRSVKYGCQESYIDCPTREKGQYLGDGVITSASHIALTGDVTLLRSAIDSFSDSSRICKGLMAVAPGSLMQEIADYSLQFPILALRYFKHTGDRDYLRQNLSVCLGIIDHFEGFARPDGLLEDVTDKWNLVDWPENLRDGYDFPLDRPMKKESGCHNVLNAFYVGCVKLTEEIQSILGIPHEKRFSLLAEAFNREFLDGKTGLYTDSKQSGHSSVHSNVLPLYFGIQPEADTDIIADFIYQKGLCCGVYMAYFLLKALCRAGKYDKAYSLIVSTDESSWYNMIREGGTTCFEAWGKDRKWNTSLCHPWASAPISVLAEDILPNMPWVGKLIYRKNIESP